MSVRAEISALAARLQIIRDSLGKPLVVSSGWRSQEGNAAVGGATRSFHPKGQAADLECPGLTPAQLFNHIEKLIDIGSLPDGGLGLYPYHVHYDTGPGGRRWKK